MTSLWEEHWVSEWAAPGLQLAPPCPETLLLTVVPDIKHTALPSAFSPGLCRPQLECRGPLLRQQWTPHLCSQTAFRHSSLPGGLRGGDRTVTSHAATRLPLWSTRHTQCLLEALLTQSDSLRIRIFFLFLVKWILPSFLTRDTGSRQYWLKHLNYDKGTHLVLTRYNGLTICNRILVSDAWAKINNNT